MLSRYVKYLNQLQSAMYAPQVQQPAKKYPQRQMPEMMIPKQMPNMIFPEQKLPENILPEQKIPDNIFPVEKMPEYMLPEEKMPEYMLPEEKMPEYVSPEMIMPDKKTPQPYVSPYTEIKMPKPYLSDEEPEERTVGPLLFTQGDPPPILSDPPAIPNIVLRKELTGYPNYGNPSGNADILYTGTRGTWTFDSPAFLFIPGNLRAQLIISAVLDDHRDVPPARYSATITVNGSVVHRGSLGLVHGAPAGGIFRNWRELTFNIPNLRRQTRVVIQNTSNAGPDDWIGLDWMEIRFRPR